jgi:dolichol-phosphate mannosyltransferase
MWLTRQAYRVIQAGSSIELPVDAGDYKLLSRPVVEHLLALRESDPYLRGLVVWIGFTQVLVPYERAGRFAGRTHFPIFSRNPWKTLITGLTSFSFLPVYVCGVAAGLGIAAAVMLAATAMIVWYAGWSGAGTIALLALATFFWGTIIGAVGVVGIYVVRGYKDVRGRPQYIVRSSVGFGDGRGDVASDAESGHTFMDRPTQPQR